MKNKNTIVTKKQTIFKNEQYEQHTNNGKKQKMKKTANYDTTPSKKTSV